MTWKELPTWHMWLLFRYYDWRARRLRLKLDRLGMRQMRAEDARHRWNVRYYAKKMGEL